MFDNPTRRQGTGGDHRKLPAVPFGRDHIVGFWFEVGQETRRDGGGQMPRRLFALLIVATGLAAAGLLSARLGGKPVVLNQAQADRPYLVVSIIETGNRILDRTVIPELGTPPLVTFDPVDRLMIMAGPGRQSRLRRGLLVHRLVQDLDVILAEELTPVRRLPWTLDFETPPERIRPAGGTGRLAPGAVRLTGVAGDGRVTVEYLGRTHALAPGERWAFLWVESAAGTLAYEPGPEWTAAVDSALSGGTPLSTLVIINRGFWGLAGEVGGGG
ncbi:MAG TPA: hypothetical protein VGL40_11005 [Bacillota bacterium]